MRIHHLKRSSVVLTSALLLGILNGCSSDEDDIVTGDTDNANGSVGTGENETGTQTSSEATNQLISDQQFAEAGMDTDTNAEIDTETEIETSELSIDTSEISGVWDGSVQRGEALDEIYWNISINGILAPYDYQGDGIEGANGNNCYLRGDFIRLTPAGGDDFSLGNVLTTITRAEDKLTIAFNEPDSADIDQDGDVDETPTFEWPLSTIVTTDELSICQNR